ncbi:uncharacterized protein LOC128242736 [Mya arenaria]|uniref:uncharacterized protein LOC128242736 n=1 Tax=Mya arenaria TaxID=6604 RepID=UPI0022E88EEE|nr:uncharacterized protein LOC128242736 [Mya arenaria]XP_052815966.1 uncharacterized protein LOC128242736 [Mya arenaria]
MTLQLVPTVGGMYALLPGLHADQDVQIAVVQTVSLAESCVSKYKSIMISEGGRIITEKDLLVASSCPSDVRVQKLMTSIKNATSSIVSIRDDVIRIQSSVHDNYEMCRERTQSHKCTIDGDTVKMETLATQISDTDSQISSCQSDSVTFDTDAGKLDARAGDIESAARKKNDAGILGAVLGGVGILLAPFTAGISLTLTTAGVATAAVNLNDAESCRSTARDLRSKAQQHRSDAENLRSRKAGLETEKSEAELEITVIKSKIDQLERASTSLHNMTSELSTFVLAIDNTLNVFQNMETCFKETLLQTESFTIIQNAFARQPEKAAGTANKYLADLKARWEALEGLLLQSGASRPRAVHQ